MSLYGLDEKDHQAAQQDEESARNAIGAWVLAVAFCALVGCVLQVVIV